MKICIIVPSQAYLSQAGVRIRYKRIQSKLKEMGCTLDLKVIDTIKTKKHITDDIYVISKCFNANTFLIANMVKAKGKLLGIDLFDDYFSQFDNSRFIHLREWMRNMSTLIDFYLCSTPKIKKVASQYINKPIGHVLNDPYDSFDKNTIANKLKDKITLCHKTKRINIAWFGIGDNPHFNVGLNDLHSYSYFLNKFVFSDYTIELNILTNRRALTVDGLEKLTKLPLSYSLDEWTIEKEKELLDKSLLAFIPVNAQNFSIAKSMNRAVTTLSSGTQVLSAGYPLYSKLEEFIYRSPDKLLLDIDKGLLLLRKERLDKLNKIFNECSSLDLEVKKLYSFLYDKISAKKNNTLKKSKENDDFLIGIIHGVSSPIKIHKHTQKLHFASVGTPFSGEKLRYDVYFYVSAENILCVQLTDKMLNFLEDTFLKKITTTVSVANHSVNEIKISNFPHNTINIIQHAINANSISSKLVWYSSVMKIVFSVLNEIFKNSKFYISENNPVFYANIKNK